MNNKNINLYKIIIWAYLHDIWKLLWRWWFNRLKNDTYYNTAHAQHLKDILLYWEDYHKENISKWIEIFFMCENNFWKDVAFIWSLHHWNDLSSNYNNVFSYLKDKNEIDFRKRLCSILYVADNVASLDRFLENNNIDEKNEKEKDTNIKNIWLWNLFDNIYNFSNDIKNKFEYNAIKIEKLNKLEQKGKNNIDFTEIAKEFYDELIVFLTKNKNFYKKNEQEMKKNIYELDLICQRYFSLIPSDTFQWKTQDLSLYDHTKIVVNISSILYKKFTRWEKINLTINTQDVLEQKISLIAWDFPSIQKYIFWWISKQKHISKRLRARSFRIQLLSEAVIEYLLEKLWYTRANVIINAWWKFVIITDSIDEKEVKKLKLSINNFLISNFNNKIYFNLISENLDIGNIFANNLWEKYNLKNIKISFVKLFDKLSKNKFSSYEKENLYDIFINKSLSWKILCKFCWNNYLDKKDDDENHENNKCKNCEKEIMIWENIVKQNHIYFDFIDKNWDFIYKEDFNTWEFKVIFNNWDYKNLNWHLWIWKSINLFVPKNEYNEIKDFNTIIKEDQWKEKWLKYLCMLKWDIDAMSIIFKHWFDFWENKSNTLYSVNRLTQFSRFLELFFWAYLNKKITENKNFENIYTVFSWWDDFIFIVPFSKRQSFINFLNEEFCNFVHNENIHFSLWLWIFKDKTPFKQMNNDTEVLLKHAKEKSKEQKKLTSRWITVYNDNFTLLYESNEPINFKSWIESWDIKNSDSYYWIESEIELSISEVWAYNLYIELSKIRDLLKEQKDYMEIVLIFARLLNMLWKTEHNDDNKWFFALKSDIINLVKSVDLDKNKQKEKIYKINQILVWLTDNMYKNRYKNTK